MYVVPRPGYVVFYPYGAYTLPPEGAEVDEYSSYWHRRLRDGDVTLGKPPKAPKISGDSE